MACKVQHSLITRINIVRFQCTSCSQVICFLRLMTHNVRQ
jgi:hypothetical protein